jgi:hypothetical protein
VYVSDVPADDWPASVDAQEPRVMRKAAEKCPTIEGPSQKRKSTGPLGTGGPLIIENEESSRKRRKVMVNLTDDEEEEDEMPLARQRKTQSGPRAPTPPRAPTLPRAATPPRVTTPPRAATPARTAIPSTK